MQFGAEKTSVSFKISRATRSRLPRVSRVIALARTRAIKRERRRVSGRRFFPTASLNLTANLSQREVEQEKNERSS